MASLYVYVFGIMGTVEGASEEELLAQSSNNAAGAVILTDISEESTPTDTTTTTAETELVFTYNTTINVLNVGKPRLADYSATLPVAAVPETTLLTTTEETEPDFDIEITAPATTEAPPTVATTTEPLAPEIVTKPTNSITTTTLVTTTVATETTSLAAESSSENINSAADSGDDDELAAEDESDDTTIAETDPEEPDISENMSDSDEEDVEDIEDIEDEDSAETAPITNNETFTVNNGGTVVSGSALDIISRIVQSEIGSSFSDEAIKAQAVASYTYVKYYNQYDNVPYVGLMAPTQRVTNLVSQVLGEAIYYNEQLIQAVYSASSAGYTASAEAVWGHPYAYLRSVECPLDSVYDPNYNHDTVIAAADIQQWVSDSTGIILTGDPSEWFRIINYVDNVYVGSMTIGGNATYVDSDGDVIAITGQVFRERIIDYNIRSASFAISYDAASGNFTFTTNGFGHGVGLSQNGANNLAVYAGYNYRQILSFFYSGVTIQ